MEHKSPLAAKAEAQAQITHLLQVPLFHRLNGCQMQLFVKTAERRLIARGQVLCQVGEKCSNFYILTQGALQYAIGELAHRLQGANDEALEIQHQRTALETALEEAQMELNDLRMLRSYR